ncbi:tumor necrosis factor receptor superfamily member 19 isoform X3 [Pan troglodytes]|uniref:tumor necrosis factor receptor superfamily member 19 isoform X3 n=1 Tax=Pan troglodytes TaxID=9598 RepID=UPI0007DBE68D|nr:tumor necrosis factor receptor superfamily member 19 isoform X2 [Pan troglodytes]XP_054521059.1 tumor necrosis factor receptor superfamily member 19 isoform X2 [Pan troglodytes]
MALKVLLEQEKTFFTLLVLLGYLSCKVTCETGDCRQQEFRDRSGNCVPCNQCGPGMELSKECGFGYGEDAQCVTCRLHRFKEDWGFQKCKPCLDCAVVNRFQKANCSATSDAICGDCLPGFYRKTKLVGFQDMECVPCGDPPPPYEPHCASKVNLVKIASTASSPRDTALAAVICSALATVLLALLILCVIYCKRQFMEKKPSWPVRLLPSMCCDEACSPNPATLGCGVHSAASLQARNAGPAGEMVPTFFGSLTQSICGEFSDAWPLMQNPMGGDNISFCDSYPELTGEDIHSLNPELESSTSLDSNSSQDLVGGAVPVQSHSENFTAATDLSRYNNTLAESASTQDALTMRSQLDQESGAVIHPATQTSLQEA